MKNLLFGVIATVLFSFIGNAQDINDLNMDVDFISYVNDDLNFIENHNVEILKKINIDNFNNGTEWSLFYTAFSTNEQNYTYFTEQQNLKLKKVSEIYNFKSFTKEALQKILELEMTEILNFNDEVESKKNCKRVYQNTLMINASVAVGAHIACLSADLTIVLGLICHGAVAVGHAAANDNASMSYQECLSN
jgi:hypothetical protein